jgi:hypothetical protein
MIKRTSKGYQVKSESGKNLSKPNLTKAEAEKRLAEVEAFKHMKKKR